MEEINLSKAGGIQVEKGKLFPEYAFSGKFPFQVIYLLLRNGCVGFTAGLVQILFINVGSGISGFEEWDRGEKCQAIWLPGTAGGQDTSPPCRL